jgi:hypothetical protein
MEEVSEDKSSKSYQVYQRLYKSRESFYAENVGLREPQEIKDILLEDLIYYTTYHLMVKVAEGSNVILAADSSALHNAASYLADTQKNLIMIYGHYQGA